MARVRGIQQEQCRLQDEDFLQAASSNSYLESYEGPWRVKDGVRHGQTLG